MSDKKPIVQSIWGGIDKSIIDLQPAIVVCKVLEPLYKKNGKAYIGVSLTLSPNEVIQVGNLGTLLKVVGRVKTILGNGAYIYQVKRVDGFNITLLEINSISVNQKVIIKSRSSYNKMYERLDNFLTKEI